MQPAARRPVTTVTWQEPQIGAFELQPHLSSPRLDEWGNTNLKELNRFLVEVRSPDASLRSSLLKSLDILQSLGRHVYVRVFA